MKNFFLFYLMFGFCGIYAINMANSASSTVTLNIDSNVQVSASDLEFPNVSNLVDMSVYECLASNEGTFSIINNGTTAPFSVTVFGDAAGGALVLQAFDENNNNLITASCAFNLAFGKYWDGTTVIETWNNQNIIGFTDLDAFENGAANTVVSIDGGVQGNVINKYPNNTGESWEMSFKAYITEAQIAAMGELTGDTLLTSNLLWVFTST